MFSFCSVPHERCCPYDKLSFSWKRSLGLSLETCCIPVEKGPCGLQVIRSARPSRRPPFHTVHFCKSVRKLSFRMVTCCKVYNENCSAIASRRAALHRGEEAHLIRGTLTTAHMPVQRRIVFCFQIQIVMFLCLLVSGRYMFKVNPNLASAKRPGNNSHTCKMVYSIQHSKAACFAS